MIQSVCQVIDTTTPILLNRRKLVNIWCHSSSTSHSNILKSSTRNPAKSERFNEVSPDYMSKDDVLKQKVKLLGIVYDSSYCNGGQSMERSLSFHIVPNGYAGILQCGDVFDLIAAGVAGRSEASLLPEDVSLGVEFGTISSIRLCISNLIWNFISTSFIPFQEKDTEKVLYGLDDIVDADEIISVEGELDKLSVEEAGFRNCVSVPGGAPGKDTAFQYLWNCKQYLDKVSRIVLATDGDSPGQALAEELACRLGKESIKRFEIQNFVGPTWF
ncbi:hypothetical protein TIFTF001_027957 [Ficus carica]|uniref:Toprim domain-containing protein n=1 Tax=Ficus carica TaxID=3494 RepID=A0AA88DQ58_FICCA|nr:hypothetical protein TIFTF001_027957 [Ficus carica]